MARKKMYVIQHGVMRPKWIDEKHIFDVPDEPVVPVTIPAPEAEKVLEKPKDKDTIMVADEPGGPRRAVKLKDGKPVEKKEAKPEPEKKGGKKGNRRGRSK